VLSDLVEQRRGLFVQLEQLRSGRDSLVEVVAAVEVTVAELKGRLAGAEHDARMAAAVGGDRAEMVVDEEVDTLLEPDIALEMRAELLGEELDADADHIAATSDDVPGERGVVVGEEVLIEEDHDEQDEDDELERDTAASHRSVGELFARIRAARGSASDRGGDGDGPVTSGLEEISEAQRGTVAPGVDLAEVEDTAAVTAQVEDTAAVTAQVEDTAAVTAHVEDTAGVEVEVEDIADAVDAAEDIAAKLRRDELLTPVLTKLGRALKRALQDDQNELLNAIRHASGTPDLERMLPEDVQLERYAMAASGALADGWLLGRTWLHQAGEPGALADSVRVSKEATERGRILGIELADELAGLLRHRLSESLRALGELGEGAHDAAGAAYREWKGPRVEGIAGDFATRAFAGGAVAASEGTTVRWVVDDGWPCPDCDDNALAGEQLAGDVWPTGQAHPPVHPGCRCLLVASTH
jgi:hypothetical protein